MRRTVIALLILTGSVAGPLAAQRPAPLGQPAASGAATSSFEATVDSVVAHVLAAADVPSASVAIVRDGRLVYTKAHGLAHVRPDVPATPDMRYPIGSVSKQFTSAALLLLQEEGRLDLDDRVSRWYPHLTRAGDITIRQLLTHTSGYSDFWPHDYVPPMMLAAAAPDSILARWAGAPLDFEPGTDWQYSNTGYVLAARIVEKETGMPFMRFLRERIFEPLGMNSVIDFDAGAMTPADPAGYERYGLGPLRVAPTEAPGWMFGAGGLAMTASDLARWNLSLANRTLLSDASYRELEAEMVLGNGLATGYGLGVSVGMQGGHRRVAHTGEVSGFVSANYVYPEDGAAVTVLTNMMAAPAASAIARAVADRLFPATDDGETARRTALARRIFEQLQQGRVDRSLLTPNARSYFTERALSDFRVGLGPLGTPQAFEQTGRSDRGGMISRSYRVTFPDRVLRVWTFETPDGLYEQYQVAPQL